MEAVSVLNDNVVNFGNGKTLEISSVVEKALAYAKGYYQMTGGTKEIHGFAFVFDQDGNILQTITDQDDINMEPKNFIYGTVKCLHEKTTKEKVAGAVGLFEANAYRVDTDAIPEDIKDMLEHEYKHSKNEVMDVLKKHGKHETVLMAMTITDSGMVVGSQVVIDKAKGLIEDYVPMPDDEANGRVEGGLAEFYKEVVGDLNKGSGIKH